MSDEVPPAPLETAPTLPLPVPAERHVFVDHLAGLDVVLRPDVNLAVWSREPHPEYAAWLDEACASVRLDVESRVLRLRPDASTVVAPLPPGRWRDVLCRDIEALAVIHAQWTSLPSARVHLSTVDTDKCRLYHSDFVGLRLLCTYSGPGTQWVTEPAVERVGGGVVILDPSAIRSLQRLDVGVLKGNAWPGNEGGGCIHRSPRIVHLGGRRMLLKVDAG